jgi:hypothetical protein
MYGDHLRLRIRGRDSDGPNILTLCGVRNIDAKPEWLDALKRHVNLLVQPISPEVSPPSIETADAGSPDYRGTLQIRPCDIEARQIFPTGKDDDLECEVLSGLSGHADPVEFMFLPARPYRRDAIKESCGIFPMFRKNDEIRFGLPGEETPECF